MPSLLPTLPLHYKKLITSSLLAQIGFLHLPGAPEFTIPTLRAQNRSSHISKFSPRERLRMSKCTPTTLFVCNGGAPPAAARSHRGGQTRSWPDSCRYASENLWVRRRRLLWAARLSNKYLMDLLISEKALLGEDAPAMWLHPPAENMRQKGRGVGGEAQRTVRSMLSAGINFSFLVCFLSNKSKNNKKKPQQACVLRLPIPIPATFHCEVHAVRPSLRQSGTLVVYEQLCCRPQLR